MSGSIPNAHKKGYLGIYNYLFIQRMDEKYCF